jgi:hypothetical protein
MTEINKIRRPWQNVEYHKINVQLSKIRVKYSFSEAQNTFSGQAQKAIFKMNKYLYKFTNISVQHRLQLFDKLVLPILNNSSEVWGFIHGNAIERTNLSFCKQLSGGKKINKMISYTVNWADFHFSHNVISTLLNIGQELHIQMKTNI